MNNGFSLVVYPVKNLDAAKKLFSTYLGTEPYVDSPYYVGYKVGDVEIGLDPNADKRGIESPIGYMSVNDIEASLKALVDAGATVQQDVSDVGGGMRIALAKDADGNVIGIRQAAQ